MDFNLLQSVRDFFTPEAINQTATQLDESHTNVSKAFAGGIPVVLAGLIHRAESGHAADVLNTATEAASTNANLNSGSFLNNAAGNNGLNMLFGNRVSGVSGAVASYAGLKNTSVQSLLGMIAPVVLTLLGRHARENNLSASGLSSYLSGQKSAVMSALPSGLNLGNLLGVNTEGASERLRDAGTTMRNTVTDAAPRRNLLWPVLIGLAAILLIYLLSRGCNNKADTTTTTMDTTTSQTTVTPAPVTTANDRASTTVKLSNNTELNAYRGGMEEQLVACLNEAACKAGKDKWFDFDNINFETGSAKLTAASQAQINNLAAILKAYPKAVVKIGGYTDKTGDEASNKKLSDARAKTVDAALRTAGVAGKQLKDPEGYGSQFAKVAATASDEERRSDRRISVQLREK